jgi:hypothetical protein
MEAASIHLRRRPDNTFLERTDIMDPNRESEVWLPAGG